MPSSGSWSSSRAGSPTRERGRRTDGPWGSFSRGARREASASSPCPRSTWLPTSVLTRDRPRPSSSTSRAIRMLCDWLVVNQVLPVNPAAAGWGPKHVVTKGATLGPDPGRGEEAPRLHRHGHARRPPRPGALLRDALQLRAAERGPGGCGGRTTFQQGSRGWLRLHEKGGKRHDVPAHHRAVEALEEYVEGGRAQGAEGGAVLERGPGGAPADREGASVAGGPGDDQAAPQILVV